jgi:hypothetical protein
MPAGLCIPLTGAMGVSGTAWSVAVAAVTGLIVGLALIGYLLFQRDSAPQQAQSATRSGPC